MALAFGFSVVIGNFLGFYPANRASPRSRTNERERGVVVNPRRKSLLMITLTAAAMTIAALVGVFLFPRGGFLSRLLDGREWVAALLALFLVIGFWATRKKSGFDGEEDGHDEGDLEALRWDIRDEKNNRDGERRWDDEQEEGAGGKGDDEEAGPERPVTLHDKGGLMFDVRPCPGQCSAPARLLDELVPPLNHSLGVIRCAVQVLEEEFGYRTDIILHTRIIAVEAQRQQQYLREAIGLLQVDGTPPDWLDLSVLVDGVLERFRKRLPGYAVSQEVFRQQVPLKVWAEGERLAEAICRLLVGLCRPDVTGQLHVRINVAPEKTVPAVEADGAYKRNDENMVKGNGGEIGCTLECHLRGARELTASPEGHLARLAIEAQGGRVVITPGATGEVQVVLRMPPVFTAAEPERFLRDKGFLLRPAPAAPAQNGTGDEELESSHRGSAIESKKNEMDSVRPLYAGARE
ncbi:hypothetical protein HM1_0403 [Heliomicrobium modesticaldum Ice1]|uniref:Uncharacterized protein n=1 Tax=Heliobacterium modesticaldum (strain ATCC 51547 / Ice1) TaxID=498761 RepID=B0TF37_HELMI|nr:hypothetical protein [Heliomicrobium modesticaldum]ABZ83020.1 hypothetical protein HM1_0403 [Heliomicrobium modesticaldum Ice1]